MVRGDCNARLGVAVMEFIGSVAKSVTKLKRNAFLFAVASALDSGIGEKRLVLYKTPGVYFYGIST
tara:strand:- start:189 stop:386 length:198 start_codon:yes stop_codon:yes gene_type:complete